MRQGGYAHVDAPDDSLVHVGIHAGDRLTIRQPNVHNHGDWRAGDVALVEHAEPTARRSPEVA